jgi:ribosome-associated protein
MIRITDEIYLDENEVQLRHIHSSGPGGQNVNKVSTAVQLRFDAAASPALSQAVFRRLRTIAGHRMTQAGVIIMTAKTFRSQERNRIDALTRLVELIRKATMATKIRRPTRPRLGAKMRRLEGKRKRSNLKKLRSQSGLDD